MEVWEGWANAFLMGRTGPLGLWLGRLRNEVILQDLCHLCSLCTNCVVGHGLSCGALGSGMWSSAQGWERGLCYGQRETVFALFFLPLSLWLPFAEEYLGVVIYSCGEKVSYPVSLSHSLSVLLHVLLAQSCPPLCDLVDCSLPGSSVHGILPVKMLEWVAISFSRGSSQPRDWTPVACIGSRFFAVWATREPSAWSQMANRVGFNVVTCKICIKSTLRPCSRPSI